MFLVNVREGNKQMNTNISTSPFCPPYNDATFPTAYKYLPLFSQSRNGDNPRSQSATAVYFIVRVLWMVLKLFPGVRVVPSADQLGKTEFLLSAHRTWWRKDGLAAVQMATEEKRVRNTNPLLCELPDKASQGTSPRHWRNFLMGAMACSQEEHFPHSR